MRENQKTRQNCSFLPRRLVQCTKNFVSTRGSLSPPESGRGSRCTKTVPERNVFSFGDLLLSEKQIPQIVGNIEKGKQGMELLERSRVRPRQARYQAALRPDKKRAIHYKALPSSSLWKNQPFWPLTVPKPSKRVSYRRAALAWSWRGGRRN